MDRATRQGEQKATPSKAEGAETSETLKSGHQRSLGKGANLRKEEYQACRRCKAETYLRMLRSCANGGRKELIVYDKQKTKLDHLQQIF